jgi:hypothetical protein
MRDRISFEMPDLRRKKVFCLPHGPALDLAKVDFAQAFIDLQIQPCSARSRRCCLASSA